MPNWEQTVGPQRLDVFQFRGLGVFVEKDNRIKGCRLKGLNLGDGGATFGRNMKWLQYTSKSQEQEVKLTGFKSKYTKYIVEKLGSCLENFFYSTFPVDDNAGFLRFVNRLRGHSSSDPISTLLWEELSKQGHEEKLRNYDSSPSNPKETQEAQLLVRHCVVQCLNKTIGGPCILKLKQFRDPSWRTNTNALIQHNARVSTARLNRLLIEDAYDEQELPKNRNVFSRKGKDKEGERTKLIKVALSELGHKMQSSEGRFKVYTNKLPLNMRKEHKGDYKSREWLYDLHWYTESKGTDYLPTGLPLVAEFQWRPKRNEDSIVS